jgi:hypothetical protein
LHESHSIPDARRRSDRHGRRIRANARWYVLTYHPIFAEAMLNDVSGITYFSDTTARSAAGNFLHVPLLVGNNAQEGDIFVVGLEEQDLGGTIPGLTQVGSDEITQVGDSKGYYFARNRKTETGRHADHVFLSRRNNSRGSFESWCANLEISI